VCEPVLWYFFRYLRGGKLFLLEMPRFMPRSSQADNQKESRKREPHSEYFWLCERCAKEMTITPQADTGAITVAHKRNLVSDPV